jgi:hypothetical protein
MRNNNTDMVKHNQNLESLAVSGLSFVEYHHIRRRLQATMATSSCTIYDFFLGSSVAPFLEYTFQRKRAMATATLTYSITFGNQIPCEAAVAMTEALARDHPSQVTFFHGRYLRGQNPANSLLSLRMMNEYSAVRIMRALCRSHAAKVVTFQGEIRLVHLAAQPSSRFLKRLIIT